MAHSWAGRFRFNVSPVGIDIEKPRDALSNIQSPHTGNEKPSLLVISGTPSSLRRLETRRCATNTQTFSRRKPNGRLQHSRLMSKNRHNWKESEVDTLRDASKCVPKSSMRNPWVYIMNNFLPNTHSDSIRRKAHKLGLKPKACTFSIRLHFFCDISMTCAGGRP